MYCNSIKEKRLHEYKEELEAQKIPFLERKLATLRKIKEDEDWMRVPCSVEEDILETVKRLDALQNNYMEINPLPDDNTTTTPQLSSSSN